MNKTMAQRTVELIERTQSEKVAQGIKGHVLATRCLRDKTDLQTMTSRYELDDGSVIVDHCGALEVGFAETNCCCIQDFGHDHSCRWNPANY